MPEPAAPGPAAPGLAWVSFADRALRQQLEDVVRPVVAAGGAVGWLATPTSAEVDGWLDTVLDDVRSGEARLATASVDGVVRALGRWQRQSAAVFRPHAEIRQLMVHPAARGLGLGRLVGQALVDDARARRFESLTLEVRGNNHGAMRLYEGLGFREVGSYPDQVALGDERWDRVLFYLGLDVGPAVVRHGRRREGPGRS